MRDAWQITTRHPLGRAWTATTADGVCRNLDRGAIDLLIAGTACDFGAVLGYAA
jgi:hypothetical protein